MPPSALISVHTVGCAWRLLMCYVNTLPKCRRGRNVPCVPISWTSHPSLARAKGGKRADGTAASREGVNRGKLMRLPAGRYRTPLSRASAARRKRESLRREVPEFKRRSRAESVVRSWHHANGERARNRNILERLSRRTVASVLRVVLWCGEFGRHHSFRFN